LEVHSNTVQTFEKKCDFLLKTIKSLEELQSCINKDPFNIALKKFIQEEDTDVDNPLFILLSEIPVTINVIKTLYIIEKTKILSQN